MRRGMYRPLKHGLQTSLGWGLSAFTPDDLDNVHYATLEVLEDVGIKVEGSEEALEVFASGGARVERQGKDAIVRIPPHVVNDCIRWAPSNLVLKGRSPEYDYALGPYRVTFATFGEMIKVFDLETRELRETTQQDCADIAANRHGTRLFPL